MTKETPLTMLSNPPELQRGRADRAGGLESVGDLAREARTNDDGDRGG